MIKAVFFDFGGVIAEEGFRDGMRAIAISSGLEPDAFFRLADDLIYETGYVLGKEKEENFWNALRERSGVRFSNTILREEILKRFTIRRDVLKIISELRDMGIKVYILSDQTNWLDELNEKEGFYSAFDGIFNSYHMGKGKRDPSVFMDICSELRIEPQEALFIDDNLKNIERARKMGLRTIHFRSISQLRLALMSHLK